MLMNFGKNQYILELVGKGPKSGMVPGLYGRDQDQAQTKSDFQSLTRAQAHHFRARPITTNDASSFGITKTCQ